MDTHVRTVTLYTETHITIWSGLGAHATQLCRGHVFCDSPCDAFLFLDPPYMGFDHYLLSPHKSLTRHMGSLAQARSHGRPTNSYGHKHLWHWYHIWRTELAIASLAVRDAVA